MTQQMRHTQTPEQRPRAANDNWAAVRPPTRRYIGPHSSYREFRTGVLLRVWRKLVALLPLWRGWERC